MMGAGELLPGYMCVRENVVTFSAQAPGIAFFVSIPG
jgi:hypothetical protein